MSHSLILSLSMGCHMAPCLSFSLSTVHSDCLRLNPDSKLIAARSNPKPELQRPTRRAADMAADYCLAELAADKRSGLSPGRFWTFQHRDPAGFLKSSLIVASCTDELLCILAFIRSDGDRRSVNRRRFSNLEKLLEDMKSFLRDEDKSASLISSGSRVSTRLHVCSMKTCSLAIF